MQASAANGFASTSAADCSGTPYNFQPEYNTAAGATSSRGRPCRRTSAPSTRPGHWEPCTSLSDPGTYTLFDSGLTDTYWNVCNGPYENTDAERIATNRQTPSASRRATRTGRSTPAGPDDRLSGRPAPERRPRLRRHAVLRRIGRWGRTQPRRFPGSFVETAADARWRRHIRRTSCRPTSR